MFAEDLRPVDMIWGRRSGAVLEFLLGLYRIADFTIRPNKNNSFYHSAEYE